MKTLYTVALALLAGFIATRIADRAVIRFGLLLAKG
jgi:hypothetical protein